MEVGGDCVVVVVAARSRGIECVQRREDRLVEVGGGKHANGVPIG